MDSPNRYVRLLSFRLLNAYLIHWRGVKFRGSALLPHHANHQKTTRLPDQLIDQKHTTMPRNKVSNDLDHVRKDPKPTKVPKEPPPKPWKLPKFTPVKIKKPFTDGEGQLPSTVASDDPYAIFNLFFNEETLKVLVQHTNEYAFLYPGPEKPDARTWFPTTVKEFRAYLGVSIWMGLHVESSISDFWNTNPLKGAVHEQVFKHISLKR